MFWCNAPILLIEKIGFVCRTLLVRGFCVVVEKSTLIAIAAIAGWLASGAIVLGAEEALVPMPRALGDPHQAETAARPETGTSMSFMVLDIEDLALSQSGQPQFEAGAASIGPIQDMLDDAAFGVRLLHKF